MKIKKLLFLIIALSFMTSCGVSQEQIKNVSQALTPSEKPPTDDKSSTSETSESTPTESPQVAQKKPVNVASVTKKKAKQGDAGAQYRLGLMYSYRGGAAQQFPSAVKWLQKTAKEGNAQTQYNLGLIYEHGSGVTKNYQEAVKWYRKAAEQGYAKAQNNLGSMYAKGDGVTKNDIEAVKWFQKAGKQGSAHAYGNWGWLLITQGNFSESQTITKKAHKLDPQNYAWTFNLGHTYLLKGDSKTARKYYQKALPLIPEDASLKQIAIFQLFISKGLQVKACKSELAWIRMAIELKLAKNYDKQIVQYYESGQFKQAVPLSEKTYRLRKEVLGEKHPDTLKSLNNLAFIYQALGRLSEALPLFEKAYRISKEVLGEKHPSTLTSLNNLASIYKNIGRLSKALPLYEKAYRLRKEVLGEIHPDTLRSLGNLAGIYHSLGRLSEALPLSEKAYRLRKEVLEETHPDTIGSLNNLAGIYQDIGRLSEALPLFEKAYRLYKEVLGEKHPDTINSLGNLAGIYQDIGRLSEALPLKEKAYRLSKEVLGEKHPDTLRSLNNLGLIYQAIGRLSEALPLFEKAYRLSQEVLGEKHPNTLISLGNLAGIYQAIGRLSEALPLKEKAYRLFQEVLGEKHPDTLTSLNNLALIYNSLGRLSEALPLYEKAYRLSQEVLGEKHPDTLTSLNNLALIYNFLGRLSEALPLYEKAYRISKEVLGEKHSKTTLISLSNLAYFYHTQGKNNKAIKYYEKLVKGVETLRQTGDLSVENRQAIFKKWVPSYFTLSYLYVKQSRFKDAFRLAEFSKSRTLLESLAAKRAAQESGLTKAEQQKLQDYEARLAFFNDKIGKAIKANRLDDRVRLETDKNQLIAKLNQFERKLKAKYPKYAELSDVDILSAKKGAKHLPKNAVLISYLVNENDILAFTLESNGKLTAHNLGEIPNLKKDLESYRFQMSRDRSTRAAYSLKKKKDTKKLSIELGKRLLEPLKEIIKDKSHWIISPSGVLALIPFETLRLEGNKQPVIAQHKVSYVQSLSILAMLQKRDLAYKQIKNRENLFAMGAPIYQKAGKSSKKAKPSSTDFKIASGLVQKNDSSRALRLLDIPWKNLPGTLEELSALKQVFRNARIYKQKQATEEKLKSLSQQGVLKKYRYLVFSAHGFLSPDIPALSSLVLGQVDNPKEFDGYVTAGEWPGYDLKSDLIVLSACETGLGEVVGGEGVMGLPYALFVAGNKNTLLTLWSISDEITVEFMTSFFRKLKAGKGQIEALTATKREFLNKGKPYNNPAYWAAFVLYGV